MAPTMALWHEDAPTKRIGVMPTPWMMVDVLGLVQIRQAHE
jgi:hypothetical protein